MSFTRSIYRLSLALLLLGGLLCPGGLATPALSAGYVAGSVLRGDSEKDGPATGAQDAQDFYLHTGRQSAPVCSDKEGKPLGNKPCFDAPYMDPGFAAWSKSALNRYLLAVQEHFTCPQRLALYPKHWFW